MLPRLLCENLCSLNPNEVCHSTYVLSKSLSAAVYVGQIELLCGVGVEYQRRGKPARCVAF